MTTITEWSNRGVALRAAAIRLEDRAAGLQGEAQYLKEVAAACDAEAAQMLNAEFDKQKT